MESFWVLIGNIIAGGIFIAIIAGFLLVCLVAYVVFTNKK